MSPPQISLLSRYGDWLRQEAIPQGGLGPNEGDRIDQRHLADSLLFASGWPTPPPPPRLADLGSGVGLPGLPLAILWPTSYVYLVERRGRRADLLRRAVRVLALENVEVIEGDASRLQIQAEMVVARAAGPVEEVYAWAWSILTPGGVAVLGGSWVDAPESLPGEEVREVPPEVLDRPVWLRIMAAP